MTASISNSLDAALKSLPEQYYRLALLVGPPGSGKTTTLQALARQFGYPRVNVNLELSQRLLDLTHAQRSRSVDRLFKELMNAITGEVVLLDNLEILFDPALEVEPLRLLQTVSRTRTMVAAWSGQYQHGTLSYAEPGHPEFAQFRDLEAVVIPIAASVHYP